MSVVDLWHRVIKNDSLRRACVLLILCAFLYVTRNILSLVLLTFIFTYLILRGVNGIHRVTKVPKKLIVIVVYLIIVIFAYFSITVYVPKLFNQTIQMIEEVFSFYQKMNSDNRLFEWISERMLVSKKLNNS